MVTFNYDTLPEYLSRESPRIGIVEPSNAGSLDFHADVPVYKLHGSVNWELQAINGTRKIFRRSSDDWACLLKDDSQIALGTPGDEKAGVTKQLRSLWHLASEAISKADALVFVGYRFPPSDQNAKLWFKNAIRENPKDLVVHLVLGPRDENGDIGRLQNFVRLACLGLKSDAPPTPRSPHRNLLRIIDQKMYAEDFLSGYSGADELARIENWA